MTELFARFFVVLLLVGIFTAGKIISVSKRRKLLKKFKDSTVNKPLYELVHNLEPMEFGYVLKGDLEYSALLAQVVSMSKSGGININTNYAGLVLDSGSGKNVSTDIQKQVLTIIKKGPSLREVYDTEYEKLADATQQSLAKKGWIKPGKIPLDKFLDFYFKKYFLRLFYAFIVMNVLVLLTAVLLNFDESLFYVMVAMFNITFLATAYFYTAIEYSKQINNHKHNLTIFASDKYSKHFNDIYGLYLYLKISGEDTMTPDYEDTLFSQLDELYPYYVTSGLDSKLNSKYISIKS